jgi:ABC-2 type transport system ATP-binding protein
LPGLAGSRRWTACQRLAVQRNAPAGWVGFAPESGPVTTTSTTASAIAVTHVTYRYPPAGRRSRSGTATDSDAPALDDLSLDVPTGVIFGLLGPNGGGKSTLFRLLATLLPLQSGAATVAGADLSTRPDLVRSRIGVTFQTASLDRRLTVRENLLCSGQLYGLWGTTLSARIDSALDAVSMRDRADDLCESLSGGMQRRVEVAKGLLHRPQLLLLDEPSTGLDPGARLDLWHGLEALRAEGMTVLLTTHLMDEAAKCDRLALLQKGRLVAQGTPGQLQSELGGQVVTVETQPTEAAEQALLELTGVAPLRVGAQWRVAVVDGPALVARLADRFGSQLVAISLSQPTLEDLFVARTGRTLWGDA